MVSQCWPINYDGSVAQDRRDCVWREVVPESTHSHLARIDLAALIVSYLGLNGGKWTEGWRIHDGNGTIVILLVLDGANP